MKKKITQSIHEIFTNATMHSLTKHVYTAGQFFPKNNIFSFTIGDTGIGLREQINSTYKLSLTTKQAIESAIKEGASAKGHSEQSNKDRVPGGLGLTSLKNFIKNNGGTMQIISSDCFYEFGPKSSYKNYFRKFKGEYPVTVVNMIFRTDTVVEIDQNNSDDLF